MKARFAVTVVLASMVCAPLVAQEVDRPSPIALEPGAGRAIGYVYEAWLSPQQEGGEEEETPGFIPPVFRSTAPSVSRDERPSQGHGVIEFARDLGRAWVHVAIEGVDHDHQHVSPALRLAEAVRADPRRFRPRRLI
ncbi:MAG: hypothetical protein R3D60_13545 [Paracoccaceae bacterium]